MWCCAVAADFGHPFQVGVGHEQVGAGYFAGGAGRAGSQGKPGEERRQGPGCQVQVVHPLAGPADDPVDGLGARQPEFVLGDQDMVGEAAAPLFPGQRDEVVAPGGGVVGRIRDFGPGFYAVARAWGSSVPRMASPTS